jgi:ABC-2 type transport system permease protein
MRRQLTLVAALARKDWQLFLADRRAAVLCFAVPIVLASVFGLVFHRPGERLKAVRLPILVVNEDDSPIAREVVADLLASPHLDAAIADRASAVARIDARCGGVAVVLPRGFGAGLASCAVRSEARPPVELLHHPLSTLESQWAEGVFTEVVLRRAAESALAPLAAGRGAFRVERPFALERATIPAEASRPFNAYSHSFSGMTLQYLLFWGMESGLLFLRERQRGIWRRFRATPAPLWALLGGRALSTAVIALLQVLATFAFGYVVFGVRVGSPAGFAALALAVSLLAAATGLLVATLGGTEARARNVCILVILAVSMLGGLWLPNFLLPTWVRDLSLALPTTWAMRGLDGVTWQGQGFGELLPSLAAVSAFSAAFLAAAMARFLWSEARLRRGWCS